MLNNFWLYAVLIASAVSGVGGYATGSHIEGIKAAAEIATQQSVSGREALMHTQQVAELNSAIAEANAALAVSRARTEAAEEARQLAVRHAEEMADQSRSREQRLDEVTEKAKGCEEVLSNYWDLRR